MYHNKNSDKRIRNRGTLFVWCFVLIVLTAIAVGDVGQDPMGAGGKKNVNPAEASIGEPIQSFKFEEDFGVRKALAMLGSMYQKNIVPTPNVDGVLAFRSLSNVTFEEAMDAVLGTNFKYEQEGQLIKVYTKEEYKKIKEDKDRMIHKVFTLYYISAAEAAKLVDPVLSGAGVMQGSTAAEAGISTGEAGVTGGEAGGDSMALHDTLLVYDYPENIAKAGEVIAALDVRPRQVLIEATILSATLTEGTQFGVDLNLLAGVSLTGTAATADLISEGVAPSRGTAATTPIRQIATLETGTPLEVAGFAATGGAGLRLGVRTGDMVALITALETVTDVTVLANPKILALNKQVGTVFIGEKLGYKSQTTQIETSTTERVTFLDTGTKLSFRPYIGDDGYIRMDIYPKDSSAQKDAEGIPTETTAELSTNIMVKDGQTIVIGGLFRDTVRTSRSQIPLLGDLPIVGAAFRSTNDSNIRQEIIVMLTPHIITEPEDTDADARVADLGRKRYGARMGLQWIGRARLAEDRYAGAVKDYINGDNQAALHKVNTALELRPTYLEALRLKERIIGEISPDEVGQMERIMLDVIELEEAARWSRR
ncbi:MAG: type II secretion system protein GspD [Planctomycetota bacterium]|jgi:type II secretory pathway component GspD/PulD (secretin)